MTVLVRFILAAMLIAVAQPAFAHGPEGHGGEQQDEAAAPAAASAQTARVEAEPAKTAQVDRPASQHEDDTASVWTRLHPATVHFPIALLLVAGLVEALAIGRSSPALASAATVMVRAGAVGAVVAALFGWIHTGLWFGGEPIMQWHRWTGTSLAIAAPLAAVLANRTDRRPLRVVLFLIALAILVQGYWGGELAHGPNHLGI